MVKRNIIANFLGQGWNALMGFAFIPFYIKYLGMESYGLIGLFAVMQAWLMLLDMGLTPTLSREMARFEAGAHTPQSICNLVRSVEWVYVLIALVIALGVMIAAPWLAVHWLQAQKLSTSTVVLALSITGCVIAMRWLGGLYRSAILGLQRQVWLNGATVVFSTLRGAGVVAVLAWVSSTIQGFFIYQGIIYALEAGVLALKMRRILPISPEPARFQLVALHQVWRFAAGMTVLTLLSVMLTQVDKLLLSKLLPLAEFGYYTLASTVAAVMFMLITPISIAASPRLTELVARGENAALISAYHKFSQTLTLLIVPIALVLSMFADYIILLWTRDAATTIAVAPLISLLAIGNMFNALTLMPFYLQLAYGWIRFAIVAMGMSVLVLMPAIYFGVSAYGVMAAPAIWIVFNICYLVLALPMMYRRLLPTEMWRWYVQDILVPAFAVLVVVGIAHLLAPVPQLAHSLQGMVILIVVVLIALVAAILATPLGRGQIRLYLWRNI